MFGITLKGATRELVQQQPVSSRQSADNSPPPSRKKMCWQEWRDQEEANWRKAAGFKEPPALNTAQKL